MEKKTKLTISGGAKKSIRNIEIAKTQGKNSRVIEKKTNKFSSKGTFQKNNNFKQKNISLTRNTLQKNLSKHNFQINDFEKRKLAEQRATKRLKGENENKEKKSAKIGTKKREVKLTVSRALSDQIEARERSLASVKRARQKENKNLSKEENQENLKPIKRDINIPESITVRELANRMAEQSSNVIKYLFGMGVSVTINQSLAADTAEFLVKEFGHNPIREEKAEEIIQKIKASRTENLKNRPPIITVMGHVDHGKTSVLDTLRSANVVSGEFGGITQHIGAYQIENQSNKLTFIDTPGHAAFTEMRARGSKVTDIVVLVIAADDGIKPQTIEAIQHSKAAKVPIIVAINKCDLPNKNISKIKNDLMQYELIAEDLSGDTLFVEVSASKKTNLDKLKEAIVLQSEILDLKASMSGAASGTVLESKIDKGKGPVSTILISSGLLKKGDYFVCGNTWGKIRAIINHEGKNIEEAHASMPVEILGMNDSAFAGAEFLVTDENKAEKIAEFNKKDKSSINKNLIAKDKTTLFDEKKDKEELNIIIKSDVQGSSEALKNAINKIEHDEVKPNIILSDIGMINETDVSLAKASKAILIGFNVKPNREAKKLAEEQNIEIKYYNIIYKALESVQKSLSGLLEPDLNEKVIGSAEILQIFKVSKAGKIAGSKVVNGEIKNKSKARLIRDGAVVYDGEISSIFREKNAVKEVKSGLECGIGLKDFMDFKEKDIIESYQIERIEREL